MSVLSYLNNLASDLNIAENEKESISTSLAAIQKRLDSYFEDKLIDQIKFGSSTRNTMLPRMADPESDVDYLIVFDNSENYTPQTFLSRLKRFADNYYSSSEIYQSTPTIVLELNHIMFDLVPAYKGWFSYYIPAPKKDFEDWMVTNPNSLNSQLDDENAAREYILKPVIRLIKYWNSNNGYLYDSFELEKSLASSYFFFCSNLKDYVFKGFKKICEYDESMPNSKKELLDGALQTIQNVKYFEESEQPNRAESEIKRLLPPL